MGGVVRSGVEWSAMEWNGPKQNRVLRNEWGERVTFSPKGFDLEDFDP